MIGKIIAGSSFGATVGYVMKEQSRILGFEGIEPPGVSDMVRDFKDQTLLNPRIKNAVGHISLSFSVKDADKLTDPAMAQIAREYMERMGIRDTQFLIVRHTDQAHPHCHIVYNRVGNDGQTISDKNIKIRNGKVCKELTAKNGYTFSGSKIDRAFSFSKLDRHFSQAQRIVTPISQPRYSAQAVGNLSAAVSHYRSAFAGLFGSRSNSGESVDLGGFGVAGGITLPPGGCCDAIAPKQMQRRIGESHEEHIARITALIRQATEAMLVEQTERSRRIREQQTKKRQIKIHH